MSKNTNNIDFLWIMDLITDYFCILIYIILADTLARSACGLAYPRLFLSSQKLASVSEEKL